MTGKLRKIERGAGRERVVGGEVIGRRGARFGNRRGTGRIREEMDCWMESEMTVDRK